MGGLATFAPGMVAGATIQFDNTREVGANFQFVQQRDTYAAATAYIVHEPVGVVASIAPWNGPYGIMASKVANALIAGCTVIMKPSPETPLDAYIIAEACEAARIPAGVVNLVCGHREASDHLVCNPGVDKVSFTGSTVAGKRIASVMGSRIGALYARAGRQVGGHRARRFLRRRDCQADDRHADAALGAGPARCSAASSCHAPRQDEIADAIAAEMAQVKIGHSDDPTTVLGPLAMKRQLERVESYIEEGKKTADLVYGGGPPGASQSGYFIEPTLFKNVDNQSRIAQEEIFGPVLSIIPVDDEEDAIRVANESNYGLSGAVLTHDAQSAYDVARRIRTGGIAQNGLKVDWGLPFGGYKQSASAAKAAWTASLPISRPRPSTWTRRSSRRDETRSALRGAGRLSGGAGAERSRRRRLGAGTLHHRK